MKQECIPVGCVPPARRPYLPGPGRGVYLVLGGWGVYVVLGGVPGPRGLYLVLGGYLAWGGTWSRGRGCTWSQGGGCTWSRGGVPGLGGVPGSGDWVYLVRGGTWSGTPPREQNHTHLLSKNITLPQLRCGR